MALAVTTIIITINMMIEVVIKHHYIMHLISTLEKRTLQPHDGCCALQWRHNGRDDVSNHQHHDCLLNRFFRRRSKKISKLRVTGLSPHKGPATRKMVPFDDVIMVRCWDPGRPYGMNFTAFTILCVTKLYFLFWKFKEHGPAKAMTGYSVKLLNYLQYDKWITRDFLSGGPFRHQRHFRKCYMIKKRYQ